MMSHSATFYGPLNEEGFGANCRLLKTCLKDIDRSKIQVLMNTLSINGLLQKKLQNVSPSILLDIISFNNIISTMNLFRESKVDGENRHGHQSAHGKNRHYICNEGRCRLLTSRCRLCIGNARHRLYRHNSPLPGSVRRVHPRQRAGHESHRAGRQGQTHRALGSERRYHSSRPCGSPHLLHRAGVESMGARHRGRHRAHLPRAGCEGGGVLSLGPRLPHGFHPQPRRPGAGSRRLPPQGESPATAPDPILLTAVFMFLIFYCHRPAPNSRRRTWRPTCGCWIMPKSSPTAEASPSDSSLSVRRAVRSFSRLSLLDNSTQYLS